MADIVERYGKRIKGMLSCFDRVGTYRHVAWGLPCRNDDKLSVCTRHPHGIGIFDYAEFPSSLCERARENAERVAAEAGEQIQFIAKAHFRKEGVVGSMVAKRGTHPGLVASLSATEGCSAAIKMYDKFGSILRIETTVNAPSFFKHHRTVEQRNDSRAFKLAPLRNSTYSFTDLRELLAAANQR